MRDKAETKVLILCTANSARSQMAEALLRDKAGDRMRVASAGTQASHVHPLAIRAMDEVGLDLREHRSKSVGEFSSTPFDYVITVCDDAAESCPVFPGLAERLHWSQPDPAAAEGSEEERLEVFREVRDALEERIETWLLEKRL